MTPVQEETLVWSRENHAEMNAALKDCRSQREADQCRAAYALRFWQIADQIGQRHGLRPMEWPIDREQNQRRAS